MLPASIQIYVSPASSCLLHGRNKHPPKLQGLAPVERLAWSQRLGRCLGWWSTALFSPLAGARREEEHRATLRHEDPAQDGAAAKLLTESVQARQRKGRYYIACTTKRYTYARVVSHHLLRRRLSKHVLRTNSAGRWVGQPSRTSLHAFGGNGRCSDLDSACPRVLRGLEQSSVSPRRNRA